MLEHVRAQRLTLSRPASRLAAAAHLLAVLLAAPSPARAGSPADADQVTPPRPLEALRADYPPGALTEHDVVLEMVVGADGRVEEARALEGQPPFTDAALRASRDWLFEPAMRGNNQVRARIRAKIHFTPPSPAHVIADPRTPSAAPSSPAAPTSPDSPAPPPAIRAPLEVTVAGAPRAAGTTSLGQAEVRALPGAFGDPFRAVEAMPGVTPVFSGMPYYYVRGAPPGNVGYFIDGIRVPALFHFLGGPGVVPPSLIERVDLFPGGYPAEHGRFAGGIVTADMRAPSQELRAEGTLRLVDAGALVEAPLPGGVGAALAGGRYSYTAPILSLFTSNIRFEFWDYQARVTLNASPTSRVTLFAFGSHDSSEERVEGAWRPLYGTDFHRVDLRYDAVIGDRTEIRQAVTFGVDSGDATSLFVTPAVHMTMVGARTRVIHRATEAVLVRAGFNAELDAYSVDPEGASIDVSLFPSRDDIAVGAFADAVIDAGRGVQLTPGARVDLWGSRGVTALSADVRFAVRAQVTPRVRLINTVGLAHQAPGFVIPAPGIAIGGLQGGLQKSFQTSASVEADLPADITGSATFFHNAFFDLNDAMTTAGARNPLEIYSGDLAFLNERALGSGVGMELYLRRKLTKQIGGFVAYTLSRSSRTAGRASAAALFDRAHVLSAAVSWEIGRGVRVGSRLALYSGMPTEAFYQEEGVEPTEPKRFPPFVRLDARAEKRWTLGRRGWISLVLEAQNATLSREPNGLECNEWSSPRCKTTWLGPITIPSLGVEGGL
jgi:TonB family protein